MIQLPRTLQPIHTFEKDRIWYVANLHTGEILQIDSLTADILGLCSTCDNAGVLERLGDRYSAAQILEGLKALSGDIETLLFEPQTARVLSTSAADRRLRIFIPHGFMKYKEILSPTTNVGIYNLLIALAKYAAVFVEIDNDSTAREQREQLTALGIQFVSILFESTDQPTYAANRFIVEDCDGILALSPHPYEELNYYRHNTIPVVSRIYSDRNLREAPRNKALSHMALRRDFDGLCLDTPWILDELASLASFRSEGLHTIPNGVDTEVYSPQNRQHARDAVASIVGDASILDAPFVGILNGFQPHNSIGMIEALAHRHQDVVFIVLDPILARSRAQQSHNVFYISLQQPEDTVALPWIYSACEFIIFPTVLGMPFSMVLEALACGIPGIALNTTKLPDALGECLLSVPLSRDYTTGKFRIPTSAISEQIDALLGTPARRETLAVKALQTAANFSWDRTAQRFVALFTALNEKSTNSLPHHAINKGPHPSDVVFSPYYDRAQNVVRTGAMQRDSFLKQRVEEGVAQTLLAAHTSEEVREVLRYLLRDEEKADRVLATLIP